MRNRPSEQSRYSRQSTLSNEFRYGTRNPSDQSRFNDSRTCRRAKTDSYFEYAPSTQSSQSHYSSRNACDYKKPSLPYYVVPVLYVPQKVLSSEEIRPASTSLQNKRTVSFLVKDQSKHSKKDNTEALDVDKIPCIPCETMRQLGLKKKNCDSEEIFMSNINLDQPYMGYINSSYAPSSTSVMEEADSQNVSDNYYQRKPAVSSGGQRREYQYKMSDKECNPQTYHHFIEQQRRCASAPQEKRLCSSLRAQVRLRWNPEYCRYEKVESDQNESRKSLDFCADDCQRKPFEIRNDRCSFDCDSKLPKRVDQCSSPAVGAPCQNKTPSECYQPPTVSKEMKSDNSYCDSEYAACNTFGEDLTSPDGHPVYISCDDQDYSDSDIEEEPKCCTSRTSTLSCEKQPELVGQIASLMGSSLVGSEVSRYRDKKKKQKKPPPDVLATEPYRDPLDDASVLRAALQERERARKPKESQTVFDDVVIYSTYVATDETIRDSKSTQTLDAGTISSTTGTQTDRILKTFQSCPPRHLDNARHDVGFNVKPRNRDTSPSPTRSKRASSPTKHSIGDVKKGPVIRSVEVTPKSSMNHSIQNCPLRKYKKKKGRTSWS